MSPLVALLLFGFMFVIALSLTLWAALTLGDARRRGVDDDPEVDYVPFGSARPVWREEAGAAPRVSGIERRAGGHDARGPGRRGEAPPERRTGLPPPADTGPAVAERQRPRVVVTQPRTAPEVDTEPSTVRRNDDYRGARATVTQRPNHDDAFERFLENERD